MGPELYIFACVVVTSYIEDSENLSLLEKKSLLNVDLVSRVSVIVINLLDTVINRTELFKAPF